MSKQTHFTRTIIITLIIGGIVASIEKLYGMCSSAQEATSEHLCHTLTPLMQAGQNGDLQRVKLLLLNGKDSNIQNASGMTALDCACRGLLSTIENCSIPLNQQTPPSKIQLLKNYNAIIQLLKKYTLPSTHSDLHLVRKLCSLHFNALLTKPNFFATYILNPIESEEEEQKEEQKI